MSLFDGRYSWDGTKKSSDRPIAWFPGSYNLKIIDCSKADQSIEQLKSHICIFSETGEGQSIYAHPEKFAQQICNDFSLSMERVLWVEEFCRDKDKYDIILFTRSGKLGDKFFYRTKRRKALAKEIALIEKEIVAQKDQ